MVPFKPSVILLAAIVIGHLGCQAQKEEQGKVNTQRGQLDENAVQLAVAQKQLEHFSKEAASLDPAGEVINLAGFIPAAALKDSQLLFAKTQEGPITAEMVQTWLSFTLSEEAAFSFTPPAGTLADYSALMPKAQASLALAPSFAEECQGLTYEGRALTLKELWEKAKADGQCGAELRHRLCIRLAVSEPKNAPAEYKYLKTPVLNFSLPCPEQTFAGAGLLLEAGAEVSSQDSVSLTLNANPFVSEMYMTNDSSCMEGGSWEAFSPTKEAWSLSWNSEQGQAQVYSKYKDVFGRESACLSDTIAYAPANLIPAPSAPIDTTAPTPLSLAINGGATLTNKLEVKLTLAASEAQEMYLSNTLDCSGEGVWEAYQSSKEWTLNASNTECKLSVKFRDAAGNESSCLTATITHDNLAPLPASLGLLASSPYVESSQVILTLAASSATDMYITNSAGCLAGGKWEPYKTRKSWTLAQSNAVNMVYAAFRDQAGNMTDCLSLSVTHDTTSPSQPGAFNDGTSHPISTVALNWTAASDGLSGVANYVVAIGSTPGTDDILSWTNVGNATSYTLRELELTRDTTYYGSIRAVDQAGNLSAVVQGDGFTALHKAAALGIGREHSCVILNTGKLKCWGRNVEGQLGQGNSSQTSGGSGLTLADLGGINLGSSRTANQVSLGRYHSCARLDNGEIKCWGYNASGELGQNSTTTLGDSSGEMAALSSVSLGLGATQISTSYYFSCALLSDNSVKCWGNNGYGQLGQGHTNHLGDGANEMAAISAISLGSGLNTTQIAAGYYHACALLNTGDVKCWGRNTYGQLGLGDSSHRGDGANEMGDNLTAVSLGGAAAEIAAGEHFSCARLNDGAVKCWGYNSYGQLGQGHSNHLGDGAGEMGSNLPAVNLGSGRTAIQLALGLQHACALLDNHTVKCWGRNSYGALGQGHTATVGSVPNEMGNQLAAIDLGSGRSALQIAAGKYHSCALLDNHKVKCWGENLSGQLGLEHVTNLGDGANEMGNNLATLKLGSNRTATFIAAGYSHSCAILDNNALKCWGANSMGQLGQDSKEFVGSHNGTTIAELSGIALGSGRTVTAMEGGLYHSCALLDNGRVKCWGSAASGQLGLGNNTDVLGDNSAEMGDQLAFVDLGSSGGGTPLLASQIAVAREHSCALLTNGKVKCWGINTYGQLGQASSESLGDEADEMGDLLPELSLGSNRSVTQIASNGYHSCALLDNGRIKCWGLNDKGQLGRGNTANYGDENTEPVDDSLAVIDLGTNGGNPLLATQVATGYHHSCALLTDGRVKCWGYNHRGQLGQGSTANRGDGANEMGDNLAFTDLGTARTATKIVAGIFASCAILDTAAVKCWGNNEYGQLGQGDTAHRGDAANEMGDNLASINLGTNRTALDIATEGYHVCALLDDKRVKCWGQNAVGELGQGHDNPLGNEANEMGDNLSPISLFP